jgi:CRISPR/Cas system CSM-associated protein Csm3 (group 7 of RAMP superfamily)
MSRAEVTDLFGGPDHDTLMPSLVRVLGTWTQPPPGRGQLAPVLRSQTAVDRTTGAGRTRSLRSREHLPVGTVVTTLLMLVDATTDQVGSLQKLLSTWRPLLGGARGSGHGGCSVSALHALTLDLGVTADLAAWLELDGPTGADVVRRRGVSWARNQQDPIPSVRRVELAVSFSGDVRVGTGTRSAPDVGSPEAADLAVDDSGNPVLPASSVRGVLRSRAELIIRSLGHECCTGFGTDCSPRCLACLVFGHTGQRGRLRVLDAPLEAPATRAVPHVAIDRFTGGAMRGGLFTETVASQTSAVLTVEIDEGPLADVAEALVRQAALDIDDGYLGLGHATRRGLGAASLAEDARTTCREGTSNLAQFVDDAVAAIEEEASA